MPGRGDWPAVAFAMAFPAFLTWIYFVVLAGSSAGLQQATYGAGKVIQFGFPLVWVLAVQRRRLGPIRPRTAGLATGAGFGLVVLAAMVAFYYAWLGPAGYLEAAASPIRNKLAGFGLSTLPRYIAMGLFYSLAHSFLEEYYWRWFVFGQLRRLISPTAAIVVSGLAFSAHHVIVLATYFGCFSVATVLFTLAIAIGGAFWAWLYQRSGSLYGPWLSHLLIDAGIFVIGYDLAAGLFVR